MCKANSQGRSSFQRACFFNCTYNFDGPTMDPTVVPYWALLFFKYCSFSFFHWGKEAFSRAEMEKLLLPFMQYVLSLFFINLYRGTTWKDSERSGINLDPWKQKESNPILVLFCYLLASFSGIFMNFFI